ncbi:hypothetical protein PHJA_002585300 [Phtheirospermum japonicum]|uniref:Uncharacterized protein n=1 Tax=Phtheirospermum japonicum TaxID=374723 RepID=A0A830D824_9LAMI|nr:hypothetical protein PHJA_002585300 [Phtheirospermum japonicum]
MDGESWDQSGHRSESKVLVGQKRDFLEVEETSDSSEKRMKKMRDLESVFRSEAQAIRGESKTAHPNTNSDSRELDLNVKNGNDSKIRAFDLDLNTEDISSSINDPFFPFKNYERSRPRDELECGSSVGPLDEKDSMRVWKGLKQNNFMSTLNRSAPTSIPKPRGRKKLNNNINNNNNDAMKKKMELAKKEQVDRFARVAAPSGLLNGLNPGIINHVRNSKQVHSIIEALVRSEKNENRNKKCNQDVNSLGVNDNTSGLFPGDYGGFFSKTGFVPYAEIARGYEDDEKLALKLSSSVMVGSENNSCLSNDESGNFGSVNSLSVKAANVASQWLELLNQDIKGRLAALRRSKKRVGAVITTELPLLMAKEFSSNCFDRATADAHSARWGSLFEQMDKALSVEESQLENWLNQVKEMQLHCDKGLYKSSLYNASQEKAPIANDTRSGESHKIERDLAVRAAAASIYSTCNFLLSMENS